MEVKDRQPVKYELETMPIWDGVRKNTECFLCDLMKQAENDALSYFLGSAIMDPSTRVQINRTGFCPHHWSLLAHAGENQSLGLIGHTYLLDTLSSLKPLFDRLSHAKPGKKTAAFVSAIGKAIDDRESGCGICAQMEVRLRRYAYTTVYLWNQDDAFKEALDAGKGVCLHHMKILLNMACHVLDAQTSQQFSSRIAILVERNLKRLERDVWWMTQKYKDENKEKSWNGCEDAQQRLVRKLVGEGRLSWSFSC